MEKIIISKSVKGGIVNIPPSKSVAHRAIICAALSDGNSTIYNVDNSKDMLATLSFVKAIGKNYTFENKVLKIFGEIKKTDCEVNCIESGSTLRFVIPIMSAIGISTKFIGEGRLPNRPIGVYNTILKGVETCGDGLPFFIKGKLQSGDFHIRGDISSQFITGLLFALPLLNGDSNIILTTNLESESYVNITIAVMKEFGVIVNKTEKGYSVKGNQKYISKDYTVEGDWSQAAFFMSMASFSENPIILKGLKLDSEQGDKDCVNQFRKMGVNISCENNEIKISKPLDDLKAITVDVGDIPDMVPALACTMALAKGTSKIINAKRLRIKESDRLKAISEAINALGGQVLELEDSLEITGVEKLKGSFVNSCNDHRILMSVSALKHCCEGDIEMNYPHCIEKSYPDFYKDYINLGGEVNVINMGK